jgi:hypothetical protein
MSSSNQPPQRSARPYSVSEFKEQRAELTIGLIPLVAHMRHRGRIAADALRAVDHAKAQRR